MLDWLVISADRAEAGRGVRGLALARFLRTYFGRRRVRLMSPAEWRREPIAAPNVFIGLPSSLCTSEIERIAGDRQCRRLASFDYLDQQQLAWTPEQESALRGRAACYLKAWREPTWNHGLPMGMLPIRRYSRFTAAVALDRGFRELGRVPAKRYDVAFVGRPNQTRLMVDGEVRMVDQRIEWVRELKRSAPELSFWGGIVELHEAQRRQLETEYGDLSDLMYTEGKVGFPTYYRALRQSRVLLAPGGNVPWSYRHYEALYAGGVVVTIDFSQRDMLVPLPREGMIHVPDGGSVMPAVREALELSRRRPTLGEENFAHLERYLRFGAYSRRRPALLERFMTQLA